MIQITHTLTHSRILTIIKHFLHPIQGEIWCLHRVVKERSVFPSNRELEITPEYLEHLLLDYRQRGYQFVNMDALVADIKRKSIDIRKKKRVVVSFDDGFRDIYDNAFPILKKYNIPFTLYLTSDFPEGKADIWWIQLDRIVENTPLPPSRGDEGEGLTSRRDDGKELTSRGDEGERFENILKEIYQNPDNMCKTMHKMTKTMVDMELCKELALSWEQLREMVDSGLCTVGGHSKTHPGLTRIPKEEVLYELTESKKVIESHLPVKVKHFSSPHSMEDAAIRSLIKMAGYETAVIGYGGGVRRGDNLYRLKRKYIVMESPVDWKRL